MVLSSGGRRLGSVIKPFGVVVRDEGPRLGSLHSDASGVILVFKSSKLRYYSKLVKFRMRLNARLKAAEA